ncbi:MAG: glycosyltransferase [Hyphomicrobiaceae bacterium]|nr:glycosyltransferase [Hyphomicrobiaceae bacterium]
MRSGKTIGCVIPAMNEAAAIGRVVAGIPGWVDHIVVADNGSVDGTDDVARTAGATVVYEPHVGYGAACLAGINALPDVDVVVFLDGDLSDDPDDMAALVDPIASGSFQFVVGSRVRGVVEAGALTPQQRFGNWLATGLIRRIWGAEFTDLGPFRAIERDALRRLQMSDRTFGWTVEMQIKAVRTGLSFCEVPVAYRRRVGTSKISGTVGGSLRAGAKILSMIAREALRPNSGRNEEVSRQRGGR